MTNQNGMGVMNLIFSIEFLYPGMKKKEKPKDLIE